MHSIHVLHVVPLITHVRSLVTHRKRATNYRALLRKMTYEDKASYDCMPPCIQVTDAWYVCSSYCALDYTWEVARDSFTCDMSPVNESWDTTRHSHVNESWVMSHVLLIEWVMSHVTYIIHWMSYESCHIYYWCRALDYPRSRDRNVDMWHVPREWVTRHDSRVCCSVLQCVTVCCSACHVTRLKGPRP